MAARVSALLGLWLWLVLGRSYVTAFSVARSMSTCPSGQVAVSPRFHRRTARRATRTEPDTIDDTNVDTKVAQCLVVLNRAAETKQEDSDAVVDSLLELEELARWVAQRERTAASSATSECSLSSSRVAQQLDGSWRLVFTTGTVSTQKKLSGQRINYFPLKAVQTFDGTSNVIQNGIYIGDFCVVQFQGRYDYNTTRRKVEFDFDQVALFNQAFTIALQSGQAAQLGSASGLGSDSNVALQTKQKKLPFFNWISADATIATARGGGGGLALWKRVS